MKYYWKYFPLLSRNYLISTKLDSRGWSSEEPKVNGGPCQRFDQCCCLVGDRVFLLGGTRWNNIHFYFFFFCSKIIYSFDWNLGLKGQLKTLKMKRIEFISTTYMFGILVNQTHTFIVYNFIKFIYLTLPFLIAPSLKTWAIMKVLEHKLDQDNLPETVRYDIKAMTLPFSNVTQNLNDVGQWSRVVDEHWTAVIVSLSLNLVEC